MRALSNQSARSAIPFRQRLQELAENAADLYVVGLFTVLCSLAALTCVSATCALSGWLAAKKKGESVPLRRYFTFFSRDLKRGLPLNALLLVPLCAAIVCAYCLVRLNGRLCPAALAALCVPTLTLLTLVSALDLFLPHILASTDATLDGACRIALACFVSRPLTAILLQLLRFALLLLGVICPVFLPLTIGLGCSVASEHTRRRIAACFPRQYDAPKEDNGANDYEKSKHERS